MIHGMSTEHIFAGAAESRTKPATFGRLDQNQDHQSNCNNHDQRINDHIQN